jgi:DNA-binding MarR family transcriptional regulator
MESVLRPYDLGTTQWYVIYQLVSEGPTMQRDLASTLQIERATLSEVLASLVRKNLDQTPSADDQRQRLLQITDAGKRLSKNYPTVSP